MSQSTRPLTAAIAFLTVISFGSVQFLSNEASAQVGGNGAPAALSPTTPLGLQPDAAVGPTGIPMGALGVGNAGVSPGPSGMPCTSSGSTMGMGSSMGGTTAGMGPSTGVSTAGMGSSTNSTAGMSGSSVNDGGGTSGPLSTNCASGSSASGASGLSSGGSGYQQSSPGSAVGSAGIPMGSTELGGAGLSPPAPAQALIPETPSPLGSSPVAPAPPSLALTRLRPPLTAGSTVPGSLTGTSSLTGRSRGGVPPR